MSRKTEQAKPTESPLQAIAKSAGEITGPEQEHTTKEAAKILRVSESWLAKGRMPVNGYGPTFSKYGRSVRYSDGDLAKYQKSRKRRSTSEK